MREQASIAGLFVTALLVAVGTAWAFQRGGHDFAVFHEAWRLVTVGEGMQIYSKSPDRFLYAPGFAWLFSPLGFLPRELALALWCLAKAAVVGFVLRAFGLRLVRDPLAALGLGAWAVVVLAKPFLVDFEYGQVNVFILGACVWALLGHFDGAKGDLRDTLRWAALAVAAFTKVFPLPLLVLPFLPNPGIGWKKLQLERGGVVLGLFGILFVPVLTVGRDSFWPLMLLWKDALLAKGLPLESHNQSFVAFLNHYLSGQATEIIAQHRAATVFGASLLSGGMIAVLSWLWTITGMAAIAAWLWQSRVKSPARWIALAVGLLIVPSHLVWKPYFVLGLPAAMLLLQRFDRAWWVPALLFASINLTGFDFVGHAWGARFEAASWLLWMHLLLLALALTKMSPAMGARLGAWIRRRSSREI